MAVDLAKQRVCVIGAGPSGTAVLRSFQAAASKGAAIPQVVCYEKQAEWGGLWNFSWRTGLAENGDPVHGSMYRHLWSNGPKEALEFADYSFEEHFGHAIPSFPPREVLRDYIAGRVEKAGVAKWVSCNSMVRNVVYDEAKGHFVVTVCDVASQASRDEIFDYVICCSGHFSTPNVPTFPGLDSFTGRVLHAHDFRSAEEFTGKDILIVGTSYSAEDIGSQCYKYGVKSVTCSWRTRPMSFHFPDNFHTRPLLQRVDGRTCYFKDGSTADVDAIILCTGYVHHFPFVEDKLRLRTANRLCPDSLHEGVVWPTNPRMMYIGMQDQWFTFNMFDAQAWYARDVIMGRIPVPDVATMAAEHAKWRAKEDALEATDEALIRYQADYVRRLVSMTDYGMFDIDGVVSVFLDWEHHKHEDIMTFRDRAHRSVKTGTMSPVHHTTWLEERNDGIENYVTANRPQSKL